MKIFLLLLWPCLAWPALAQVIVRKTPALQLDADANGKTNPGDTLRYTITITNTSGTNLLNVVFSDTDFPNQTLVPNSIRSTPIARPDGYGALANSLLSVPATSGVLINDSDPDGDSIFVVAFLATSAQGGTVSVANDGGFTYRSATGFTGTDTFTYTINDGNDGTNTATVTLVVGAKAVADVIATGPNNDLHLAANNPGAQFNVVRVDFVPDLAAAGSESATYNTNAGVLMVHIKAGAGGSTCDQVIVAIDTEATAAFDGSRATAAEGNNGTGTYSISFAANLTTTGDASTKAVADVTITGANNDIHLVAAANGAPYNIVRMDFVNDLSSAGSESAAYNATAKVLTVHIKAGAGGSTCDQVIGAITAAATFNASRGTSAEANNGTGTYLSFSVAATLTTVGAP